jgi:hypothetical protein
VLPHVEIGRLQVRCIGPGASADAVRARLADIGSRLLPAALDRALGDLDDGTTLVILRRVATHVPLVAGEADDDCAARWAERMVGSVRAAVADLAVGSRRSVERDAGIAFADPVALLAELVTDAAAGRLERWCWQPEAGALAAVQRALAALPGSDGRGHAYASSDAPPPVLSPSGAVRWALGCAGAALPALVSALHDDGAAAAVLALLPAGDAQHLATALGDLPPALAADRAATRSDASPLFPIAARIAAWPAAPVADARNVVLLLALAIAAQPSLRGSPGVSVAALRALCERARPAAGAPETSRETPIDRDPPRERGAEIARGARDAPDRGATAERAARGDGDAGSERSPAERTGADPAEPPERRRSHVERAPTGYGGLLFLIPILQDLQIPAAILDEPALAAEPGLGAVLHRLACVAMPDAWADRAALWLAGLDEPAGPVPALDPDRAGAALRVGQRVARAAGELGVDEQPDDPPALRAGRAALPGSPAPWLDELCLHFAVQVTAALRARTGLELAAGALLDRVIRRTGTLVRTATHLRLELPIDAADVDLRRALLDLDPGWVPFLGRVVSFHYV